MAQLSEYRIGPATGPTEAKLGEESATPGRACLDSTQCTGFWAIGDYSCRVEKRKMAASQLKHYPNLVPTQVPMACLFLVPSFF
jgi:hypothetical protein